MANISQADGTITFEEAFAEKHQDLIDNYIEKHTGSYYGIKDLQKESNNVLKFYADGRWAYCHTLQAEGLGWTEVDEKYSESRDAVMALAKALADENSVVTFKYIDYEPGCCVLYEATTEIRYSSATEFEADEVEANDIEYNHRNLAKYDFEPVAYDFKSEEDADTVSDRINFRDFIRKEYEEDLKEYGLTADEFAESVIKASSEDSERDGILFDWEVEDKDYLLDLYNDTKEAA